MRQLIVAGHEPENVILMEIDPEHQKTLPDFLVTQRKLGIAIVDILSLKKRGRKLFYTKDGREVESAASTTAALWTSSNAKE